MELLKKRGNRNDSEVTMNEEEKACSRYQGRQYLSLTSSTNILKLQQFHASISKKSSKP